MSAAEVPAAAIETAAKMSQALHFPEPWDSLSDFLRNERLREAQLTLEAAAPYMLADMRGMTAVEIARRDRPESMERARRQVQEEGRQLQVEMIRSAQEVAWDACANLPSRPQPEDNPYRSSK